MTLTLCVENLTLRTRQRVKMPYNLDDLLGTRSILEDCYHRMGLPNRNDEPNRERRGRTAAFERPVKV